MDVDLSTDLAALLPLVAPLLSGHSDVAIGSRLSRSSRVVRGTRREFISRSYPDATRRADQADQHAHQRLADRADHAAAYADSWERHVAERQAEREAARVAARHRTLDYDYGRDGPSRGHGIER